MKPIITLSLFALVCSFQSALAKFQYLSPLPGSTMINVEHNIIIRDGNLINAASLTKNLFSILGSKSSLHDFNIVLSADGKTIILNPTIPFSYDEEVSVTINNGIEKKDGGKVEPYTFSFKTHREYTTEEQQKFKEIKTILQNEELKQWSVDQIAATGNEEDDTRQIEGMFDITINNNPTAGDVFFDSFSGYGVPNVWTGYNAITSDGDSVFAKSLGFADDFKLTKKGYFSVYNGDYGRWDVLDSNFSIIDTYYPANGYGADNHEFQMLANGHVFVIALEYQTIDMTVYNPDYVPNATVLGAVIQEFDENKNLVFEWRSFDHVIVTEALHENLASGYIDYMHTNAIEIDNDGNILTSNRHLDQVNKIDRNTGEFIWRLGGMNNQFTFINEPEPFTYQHDIRRIANGNITLFDNGNWHVPARSAAKEYQLDEVNKTATLVWKFGHPDNNGGTDLLYFAMGNTQRLSNGNTFINWGWRAGGGYPSMSEVTPDGTIIWELKLTSSKNMVAYRSHKYEWDPCARPVYQSMKAANITSTSAKLRWHAVAGAVKYKLQYRVLGTTNWTLLTISGGQTFKLVQNLLPATKYEWQVETWCDALGTKSSGFTSSKKFQTNPLKPFLSEEAAIEEVVIYPNPAHDFISIECGTNPVTSIRILNLLGQEVMYSIVNKDGNETIQLALNHLSHGNYFVELTSGNQKTIKKIVVE